MKMGFRDRDVIVEPGEFIIVPHGTEHRPEALDGECHVLMIEPNSTLNTGNVETEKTRLTLHRLDRPMDTIPRSDARREEKGWVGTGRSRGSAEHEKKNK